MHLEGSLAPETLWALAQRQGFPFGLRDLDACRQLYTFNSFDGFIHAIKTASQLLLRPDDYAIAVRALARGLQAQGVLYSEVFLSIGILLWRNVAVEPYWEAIEPARLQAEKETGVTLRWIFDAVRQFGPEPFQRVVDWAVKLHESKTVLGIGIGGDERQRSAAEFAPGYARARLAGLKTTVHAGETCGADSIWDALNWLKPDRIGHGLRAFEDARLLDELISRQTILDICPTSNLKTGAWPSGLPHPAYKYYMRGIKIAVSSDDPGIFGCSLLDEYCWLAAHGGFSFDQLTQLATASLDDCQASPRRMRVEMDGCE
ncbi:MAG: adenosine deaminase [Terriglobales bacterium]